MSEQVFLDYMEANGYTKVEIKRYKIRDHVWFRCPPDPSNPEGIKVQVILRKGVYIRDLAPEHYTDIAMSQEDRALWRHQEFFQTSDVKEVQN